MKIHRMSEITEMLRAAVYFILLIRQKRVNRQKDTKSPIRPVYVQ